MNASALLASPIDSPTRRPRVSVVMAAYNAAQTIARSIESVRQQTMTDWELLIIDDGSKDETRTIAGAYAARDQRIRVITKENAGPAAARNRGIAESRGTWLSFHDSDDWVEPSFLARLLAIGETANGPDVVSCTFVGVDPKGVETTIYWAQDLPDPVAAMTRGPGVSTISMIARADMVRALGGFDEGLITGEDWDLWLRLARIGARFAAIPDKLAYYRKTPGSLSKKGARLIEDALVVMERAYAPDPRLKDFDGPYREGYPSQDKTDAQALMVLYNTAISLASGQDPAALIDLAPDLTTWSFDAQAFSKNVLAGVAHGLACREEDVQNHWASIQPGLAAMGAALARKMGRPRQAGALCAHVEARARTIKAFPVPKTEAGVLSQSLDIRHGPSDIPAPGAECAVLSLVAGQEWLGHIEAPVLGGVVARAYVAEAIARASRHARLRTGLQASGLHQSMRFWLNFAARALDPQRLSLEPEHPTGTAGRVKGHLIREAFCAMEATLLSRFETRVAPIPPPPRAAIGRRRKAGTILVLHATPPDAGAMMSAFAQTCDRHGFTPLTLSQWAGFQAAGLPPRGRGLVFGADGEACGAQSPLWQSAADAGLALTIFLPRSRDGALQGGWTPQIAREVAALGHEIGWRLPTAPHLGEETPASIQTITANALEAHRTTLGGALSSALAPPGGLDRTAIELLRAAGVASLVHPRAGLTWLDTDRMLQSTVPVWRFDTVETVLRRLGVVDG